MGIVIGTDEAGYGPNLGPLVIATTVWETRDHPADVDLWDAFADVVTPQLDPGDDRLHLADSKAVYSPATGLARLEATVLSAWHLLPPLAKGGPGGVETNASSAPNHAVDQREPQSGKAPSPPKAASNSPSTTCGGEGRGEGAEANASTTPVASPSSDIDHTNPIAHGPTTGATPPGPPLARGGMPGFAGFCEALCVGYEVANSGEACLKDADVSLPTIAGNDDLSTTAAERWRTRCDRAGIQLRDIRCDIIWPKRCNAELETHGNKAAALTSLSLRLLRQVWNPATGDPTLIVCDKHGGRNRYDPSLQAITGDAMIFRLRESKEVSRYRIGRSEIQFRKGGESHLPVALASMFAKYIRELSMELFNRFWARHVPDIRPTKGYPVDAKRFRAEIAEAQAALGMPNDALWRSR